MSTNTSNQQEVTLYAFSSAISYSKYDEMATVKLDSDGMMYKLNSILIQINKALDDYLIPTGSSITEIIASYTYIQLARCFTRGYTKTELSLHFDETSIIMQYFSSAETRLRLEILFNNNMLPCEVTISITIPKSHLNGDVYNKILTEMYSVEDFYDIDIVKKQILIKEISTIRCMNMDSNAVFHIPEEIQKTASTLQDNFLI